MSEFDSKAREWDNNPVHWARSEAIAESLLNMIPVNSTMQALEYGAGTGILSFLLSDYFSKILLMDISEEMVKVMHEKVAASRVNNLEPILFDLEKSEYSARKFDCIFTQMVMHHVADIDTVIKRLGSMINPGGYIAISDLYPEDGSFHGPEVKVHSGIDPDKLTETLKGVGFKDIEYKQCFEITRDSGKKYPIFLLVGKK